MLNKHVLITGASTGIGREFSFIFAEYHFTPILVARNEKTLKKLQKEIEQKTGQKAEWIAMDLSLPESPEQLFKIVNQIIQAPLFALVNNAGFGLHGKYPETDLAQELNMIDLNMRSLAHLTKLFLPQMVEAGHGKILNVASIAAFMPGPLMAVYYASKAFVLSYSEALYSELKPYGIVVSALAPGPTKTKFAKRANLNQTRMFDGHLLPVNDAHSVALAGYKGMMKGKAVVIPGLMNKLTIQSLRFLPRSIVRFIAYQIMKKR